MVIEIKKIGKVHNVVINGETMYTTTNREDAEAYKNMVIDYHLNKEKSKNEAKMRKK